jgi:quercetin dioxygenase-like cupin family protein
LKIVPYSITNASNFKWARFDVKGSEGKAWIKIFAKDPDTGAAAALVKFDAGFTAPKATSSVFSDTIVVEGAMRLGGKSCGKFTYFYRPAGVEYGPIKVEQDTSRFVITGGRGEKSSDKPVFIQNVEGESPPWSEFDNPQSRESPPWQEKILRTDRKANVVVQWNLSLSFHTYVTGKQWVHPATEEAYCLEGEGYDYCGEAETYAQYLPGSYIYRPAGKTFHGGPITYKTPRRLFVKYYDANPAEKFARKTEKDILPPSFPE